MQPAANPIKIACKKRKLQMVVKLRILSYGGQPFSGCVTSQSPDQLCINRISSFLLRVFILTSFAFLLILLLKTKSAQFALKLGIILAFQNEQEINSIFKMAASSDHFYFRIAILFLILYPILIRLVADRRV